MEKIEKPLTDEDLIMGKTKPDTYTVTELNAFTDKVIYEVKNIELNNNPTLLYGNFVVDMIDDEARKKLEKGAKSIKTDKYEIKVYKTYSEPQNKKRKK